MTNNPRNAESWVGWKPQPSFSVRIPPSRVRRRSRELAAIRAAESAQQARWGNRKLAWPGFLPTRYDSLGRSRQIETRMDNVTTPYTAQTSFDGFGRMHVQVDASGDSIRTEYTQRGFVKRQREAAGAVSGSVLNEIRRINARGQVVEERRGGLATLATVRDYWLATGRLKSIISGGGAFRTSSAASPVPQFSLQNLTVQCRI